MLFDLFFTGIGPESLNRPICSATSAVKEAGAKHTLAAAMVRRASSADLIKKKVASPKKKVASPAKKKAVRPAKKEVKKATRKVASGGRPPTAGDKMMNALERRLLRSLEEQLIEMQTFVSKEEVAVKELRENMKESFTRIDAVLRVCPEHMSMNKWRDEADATLGCINTILSGCPADAILTRSREAEQGTGHSDSTAPDS